MPQNNPSGYNQVSSKLHTQHFLENLNLGANLKQRQRELDASNNISEQEQILNEQGIERNEQIMAKAAEQALMDAFNREESHKNAISLGTIPSDFSGSQGEIFDIDQMIPERGNILGSDTPTKRIEFGERTAKNYKGEDVTVGSNESSQRRGAVGNQLRLKEQESVAGQAGQLLYQQIAGQNAMGLEQYRAEQRILADEARSTQAKELQGMRSATQMAVARINKTKPGASARFEEEYEYAQRGLLSGQKSRIDLKREGFTADEIGQIVYNAERKKGRVLSDSERKSLTKDREAAANFQKTIERFRDLTAQLSNTDDQAVANIRSAYEKGLGALGIPTELYKEWQVMKAEALKQAKIMNGGRPTKEDAQAAEFEQISIGNVNNLNQKLISRFGLNAIDTTRQKYNVEDFQFDIMFEGTDLQGIAALRQEFEKPLEETEQYRVQQVEQEAEAYRQKLLAHPDYLKQKNQTVEEAMRGVRAELNKKYGLDRAMEEK